MHLQLIGDDRQSAALIVAGLTPRGHEVQVVNDGAGARAAARTRRFDLVITDRMLPDADDVALIAALRTAGQRAPVLVLTAMGTEEDRVSGLEGGADDYLITPFSMAELAARVAVLGWRGDPARAAVAVVAG